VDRLAGGVLGGNETGEATGQVVVTFTTVKDNAQINAIIVSP